MFEYIKSTYKVGDAITLRCKDGVFSGRISFISDSAIAVMDKDGQKHLVKGEDIEFCEDYKETEAPADVQFGAYMGENETVLKESETDHVCKQATETKEKAVEVKVSQKTPKKRWWIYGGVATAIVIICLLFKLPTKVMYKLNGNKVDGHEYVDLGLPSGTLWATCNIGANMPTEFGDYIAWGETKPKNDYSWENYKWCKGSENTMTKYCDGSEYGEVDGIKKLLSEDDAATANWGAGWRMPTKAEQEELRNGCNWEWTYDFNGSGVVGQVGTSKTNGNTIFLPVAGGRYGTGLYYAGIYGGYCSSSLYEDSSNSAYNLIFDSGSIGWSNDYRYIGQSVRAVVK